MHYCTLYSNYTNCLHEKVRTNTFYSRGYGPQYGSPVLRIRTIYDRIPIWIRLLKTTESGSGFGAK
jgi:hypothetical protein